MLRTWNSSIVPLALFLAAASNTAFGQSYINNDLVFATNQGLFQRVNGQTQQIPTSPTTGLFPNYSRDGRFLTYSRPDLGSSGVNPSSDLVVLDRTSGQQRVIINNNTATAGGDFDPLSSQVSPNGQFVAYGVRIDSPFTFDQSNPTTELVIADFTTGVALSSPFADRINQLGTTSDALSAEFRGISFLPGSNSFVTPVLDLIFAQGSAVPDAVTSIVRFDRNGSGQWAPGATLSTPTITPTSFISGIPVDVATTYQTYPAISPSGAGLAYFDVFKPTRTGSLTPQASQSRVILANADGSNASILTTFSPGFLPTGLTWAPDGSALLVSVSEQANLGTGFLDLPDTSNSAIFTVSTSTGVSSFLSQFPNAFGPTLPLASVASDFNGDGTVNGFDFLQWQRGESPNPFSAADLAAWRSSYGTGGLSSLSTNVPEPSGLILAALAALLPLGRKRSAVT